MPGQGALRATRGEEAIHFGRPGRPAPLCRLTEPPVVTAGSGDDKPACVPPAPFPRRPLSFGAIRPPGFRQPKGLQSPQTRRGRQRNRVAAPALHLRDALGRRHR